MDRFDIELMELLGMNEEQYLEMEKLVEEAVCESVAEEIEEGIWDDDDYGYSYNCPCDTYGMCGGTSCPQFWQCHSK